MNKEKISTISLWSFLFVIAIGITNLNNIIWQESEKALLFTNCYFLPFFFFLAGYFLMKHYQKNKDKKEDKAITAWKYAGNRFSKLYPAMLGGVAFAFIVRNAILKTSITNIFSIFMDSLWEFIGLSTIGSQGATLIWNEPLWYISAIIIASLLLYYIVSEKESFFTGFFAPLVIILTYTLRTGGFLHVLAAMCAGMLLHYVIEYFKEKELSEIEMMCISLIHIGIIMLLIYFGFKGIPWNSLTTDLILYIFTAILLINKDYIAVLYNKCKMTDFFGKLSLYYFATHIAFIYLLAWLFPEMDYHASIVFNILFSTCWGFIMMYVDDYVITPIFRIKKEEKKKATREVKKTKNTANKKLA